jgi:hemoglobin
MKKDIEGRADIELFVQAFYEGVKADELLGPIFRDVAKVNWELHLPKMYSFWENIIFHTGGYEGNPMDLHKKLHNMAPLAEAHFNQWNSLFITTLNKLFTGPNVELAISNTMRISDILKQKILEYQNKEKET